MNKQTPVLWTFRCRASALGLYVDDERCWVGDEAGHVFALDNKQKVVAHYALGVAVKALVADERWIYAGNDRGVVFDLSRARPTVAYEIARSTPVYWLAIHGGTLCVSDAMGHVSVYDHEGDLRWSKKGPNRESWMVRADDEGVFHGTGWTAGAGHVSHYDWSGKKVWRQKTEGGVGFGWLEDKAVYASTDEGVLHVFGRDGTPGAVCRCDDRILSCATSEKGKRIFAGDEEGDIYCFTKNGNRRWKLNCKYGSPQSMQYHGGKLYIVTEKGLLVCIDVSDEAAALAKKGKLPRTRVIKKPTSRGKTIGAKLNQASGSGGVLVECRMDKGRLRVFPVDEGYHRDWRVQFPRDLRKAGAQFVVEELVVAKQGGFYRAVGEIKKPGTAKRKKSTR